MQDFGFVAANQPIAATSLRRRLDCGETDSVRFSLLPLRTLLLTMTRGRSRLGVPEPREGRA